MKIFYSWQTTNGRRQVVENYLKAAIESLNVAEVASSEDSDEVLPEFARYQLDHDTKGVSGSPPIFDTVLQKISECDVFVADMTPVEVGGRYYPNPNVMAEYGYALRAVGHQKIINIVNVDQVENYDFSKMPFDMRHNRKPIEIRKGKLDPKAISLVTHAISEAARLKVEPSFKHDLMTEYLPGLTINPEKPVAIRKFSDGELPIRWTADHYFYIRFWPANQLGADKKTVWSAVEDSRHMLLPLAGCDGTIRKPDSAVVSYSNRVDREGDLVSFGFSMWRTNAEVNTGILINAHYYDFDLVLRTLEGMMDVYYSLWGCHPTARIGLVLEEGRRMEFSSIPTIGSREIVVQDSHTQSDTITLTNREDCTAIVLSLAEKFDLG